MNNNIIAEKAETKYEKYNCEYCGKEFERTVTKGRKKRFCDRKCGDKAKALRYKNKFTLLCNECGCAFGSPNKKAMFCSVSCQVTFNHKKSKKTYALKRCEQCEREFLGKAFSKYCSDECKYENQTCPQCNITFKVERGRKYKKTFCSTTCRSRSESKHLSTCENCGSEFIGKINRMNKFCSRKCFYERMGYEEHGVKRLHHLSDASSIQRAIKYGVKYENIDILKVFEINNWLCGICNEKVDNSLVYPNSKSASLDHVIPLSKGGTHTYNNVQLAHLGCNIRKNNKLDESHIQSDVAFSYS